MKSIKKIFFVGTFPTEAAVYTYSISFVRAFQKLGYLVDIFDYRAFSSPLLMNYYIRYAAWRCQPDCIFVLKGELLSCSTIQWLKKNLTSLLINFYPDNPFVIWNGNSNSAVLASLPLYDDFLIWSHQLIPLLYAAGARSVHYFPFGYDDEIFEDSSPQTHASSWDVDISFVGSWDAERESWMTALVTSQSSLNIAMWGNQWNEALPSDAVLRSYWKGAARYGRDLVSIIRSSRINLNFIRAQNCNAHNMRSIEIPAAGGLLLTERTDEQAVDLFTEGKEIVCFGSTDELQRMITWCCEHEQVCREIAAAGRMRAQSYRLSTLLNDYMNLRERESLCKTIKKGNRHDAAFR